MATEKKLTFAEVLDFLKENIGLTEFEAEEDDSLIIKYEIFPNAEIRRSFFDPTSIDKQIESYEERKEKLVQQRQELTPLIDELISKREEKLAEVEEKKQSPKEKDNE